LDLYVNKVEELLQDLKKTSLVYDKPEFLSKIEFIENLSKRFIKRET